MPRESLWFIRSTFDRKQTASNIVRTLKQRIWIILCYSTYWVWMMSVFQEPTAIFGGLLGDASAPYAQWQIYVIWFGPLVVMTLVSGFIAFWFKRTRIVFKSKGYQSCIILLMFSGAVLHALWGIGLFLDNPEGSLAILVIRSILVGVGVSLFRIEIDRVFGYVGANQTLFITAIGLFIAMLVVLVLTQLPWMIWLVAALVLPAFLYLFYWLTTKTITCSGYYSHGIKNKLFIPWKFLSTSFIQGIAFGAMSGGMLLLCSLDSGWLVGTGSRLLALLLLGAVMLFLKLDYNQLLYKLGFPFMALGFACLLLLPNALQLGGLLAWAGYLVLDMVLWSLGAYLIKNDGLPATWIASFPGAVLSAGTILGALASMFIVINNVENIAACGGLMAIFLLATALVMTSSRNIQFGWGTSRPYHTDNRKERSVEICNFLSAEYGLTKRETDVLLCLIAEQKRKDIGDVLCVSKDTVKTHTRSIYRKLLVHSSDELQEVASAAAVQLGIADD
ncbi:MAG: helix-turn-helix transcriptional regulator [Coriobacteriales bacterium]|nr:helix-turn-helix transcriptional regulator [Coriobacteriales bacterium]